MGYARSTGTVERHVKDSLNDPLSFLVNHKGVFLVRVTLVAERRIGKDSFAICKFGVQRGLDLAAGILRKPLVGDGLFGKGIDKLEKT